MVFGVCVPFVLHVLVSLTMFNRLAARLKPAFACMRPARAPAPREPPVANNKERLAAMRSLPLRPNFESANSLKALRELTYEFPELGSEPVAARKPARRALRGGSISCLFASASPFGSRLT